MISDLTINMCVEAVCAELVLSNAMPTYPQLPRMITMIKY